MTTVLCSPGLMPFVDETVLRAQVLPPLPPQVPIPLPPRPPRLPETPLPQPPAPLVPTPPQPPGEKERVPQLRVFVREIRVVGNTVFSDEELGAITAPYTNRELSSEDLEELRQKLTLFYINRGYVTSGAILPDQTVSEGVVTFQIIEGTLSRIDIEGNRWFAARYLRSRIALGAGPPVNINTLQERLQILQMDPRIQRLNAELRPGLARGESVLNVRVKDVQPFHGWVEFNNFLSPTVGAEEGLGTLVDDNVTGFGDQLSVQYGRSAGVNPILNVRYAAPITRRDTTLTFQYRRTNFSVQEAPFEALDIVNKAQIYSIGLRHPVYRTLQEELGLAILGDHEINRSFLQGEPFEFIAGATNGVFRVSALRFAQDYTRRSPNQVISAFSRFSVGFGVLGATATGSPTQADARFFSWLGEAQWARQLQTRRIQLIAKTTVQLSNDHLFPLEQIAVGGRFSVRGYREYTRVQDNATLASFEARIPLYTSSAGVDVLYLAPFVDFGHSWNTTVDSTKPQTLASVGTGLLWNPFTGAHFEAYWGQRLNHVPNPHHNVQDYGVHVQAVVQAF